MAERSGVGQPRPGLLGRFTRWLWHLAQGEVVKRVGGPDLAVAIWDAIEARRTGA